MATLPCLVFTLVAAAVVPAPAALGAAATTGTPTRVAEPVELWALGNSAFRAGHFDEAIAHYRALLEAGVDDGEVYYNLGNAHLRRGEVAQAIAAYRAAQARLPRNEDVEANLRFARGKLQDAVAPPEPPAALRTLLFWHYGLSERELALAAVIAQALFFIALGLAVLARLRPWRWAAGVLGLAVVALVPSLVVRVSVPTRLAVVAAPELPVRSGVGADNVVLFRLHEGAEAWVTAGEDDWLRVRLADGKQGWVPRADLLVVRL
jgi:hypothetical protein